MTGEKFSVYFQLVWIKFICPSPDCGQAVLDSSYKNNYTIGALQLQQISLQYQIRLRKQLEGIYALRKWKWLGMLANTGDSSTWNEGKSGRITNGELRGGRGGGRRKDTVQPQHLSSRLPHWACVARRDNWHWYKPTPSRYKRRKWSRMWFHRTLEAYHVSPEASSRRLRPSLCSDIRQTFLWGPFYTAFPHRLQPTCSLSLSAACFISHPSRLLPFPRTREPHFKHASPHYKPGIFLPWFDQWLITTEALLFIEA